MISPPSPFHHWFYMVLLCFTVEIDYIWKILGSTILGKSIIWRFQSHGFIPKHIPGPSDFGGTFGHPWRWLVGDHSWTFQDANDWTFQKDIFITWIILNLKKLYKIILKRSICRLAPHIMTPPFSPLRLNLACRIYYTLMLTTSLSRPRAVTKHLAWKACPRVWTAFYIFVVSIIVTCCQIAEHPAIWWFKHI